MKNKFIFILMLVSLAGCKTTEEIQREQMINNMSIQMSQNQQLVAETKIKLEAMEEKARKLQGSLELQAHKSDQFLSQTVQDLKGRMELLEEAYRTSKEDEEKMLQRMEEIERNQKENKEFLNNVINLLKSMNKTVSMNHVKKSDYAQAFLFYKSGKYENAKILFLKLLQDKKLSNDQVARITHGLGTIAFTDKRYEDSMSYMSKVFKDYPSSPYVTSALITLAKSLHATKKVEAAVQTLNELIGRYPQSKKVPEAKELLKKYSH